MVADGKPCDEVCADDLREQLKGLKLSALAHKAREVDVLTSLLYDALDDGTEALTELIVQKVQQTAIAQACNIRGQLKGLKLSALAHKAKEVDVLQSLLYDALDDGAEAVIELIVQKVQQTAIAQAAAPAKKAKAKAVASAPAAAAAGYPTPKAKDKAKAEPAARGPAPKVEALARGDVVEITKAFLSNSAPPAKMQPGQVGKVTKVDKKGAAAVEFPDHEFQQWIWKQHFGKLRKNATDPVDTDDGSSSSEEEESSDDEESSEEEAEESEAEQELVVEGHVTGVTELKGKKGKKGHMIVEFKYDGDQSIQLVLEQGLENIVVGQAATVALEGAKHPKSGESVQRKKVAGEWCEGALVRLGPLPVAKEDDGAIAVESESVGKVDEDVAGFGFDSVREAYDELGTKGFYEKEGKNYHNPHEPILHELLCTAMDTWESQGYFVDESAGDDDVKLRRVLDLACGSGEASVILSAWAAGRADIATDMDAADPYTYEAYENRMARQCYRWTFKDISAGGVLDGVPPYDMVLCTYSLHLLDKSWLHGTLTALARASRLLLVATPHKRPVIEASMGWRQLGEVLHDRVRVRLYQSILS